jgi:CubicO group peptidase (beta-lactamase class C family)
LDQKISRWFPQLLAADQVTVRMLVANTSGYIDYVPVDDFVKLELEGACRPRHDRPAPGKHVKHTDSGHFVYTYAPQLVADALHEVVAIVRSGSQ